MFSLNRAQIVGNMTRDPEMRYTPNGQAVCSFSVATNRRWKGADGTNQEATEFHNIVAWTKLAEIMTQILKKGNKVFIEGRLQTRSWEGQDGAKRQRTEIVAENFIALTPKSAGGLTPESPEVSDGIEEFPTSAEATAGNPVDKSPSDAEPAKEAPKKPKSTKEEDKKDSSSDDINLDEIPF